MKCQIKNIKSSEEFETYKEFIDNEIKLMYDIRYDVRFISQSFIFSKVKNLHIYLNF
jgi:hypothetical protein